MALKKITFTVQSEDQENRLDQVLAESLPKLLKQDLSKGKIRKLIIAGAVYLNNRRIRIASKKLLLGSKIDVHIDLIKLSSEFEKTQSIFVMNENHILFEDEDLIVIDKPAGLPTQPTLDDARNNLYLEVRKFLSKREKLPIEKIYVGLHHRLDRDTSGVILMTKSKRANPGIADLFSTHSAQKTYQALSVNPHLNVEVNEGRGRVRTPPLFPQGTYPALKDGVSVCSIKNLNRIVLKEWTVKNYLGRAKDISKKKNRFTSVSSGGDFAHTEFFLLEEMKNALWIKASPVTGRTHQIRVHLAEAGMPILGDVTYGGPTQLPVGSSSLVIPRIMLHAVSLSFVHPIGQQKMTIQSHLPKDFDTLLNRLRKRAHL